MFGALVLLVVFLLTWWKELIVLALAVGVAGFVYGVIEVAAMTRH